MRQPPFLKLNRINMTDTGAKDAFLEDGVDKGLFFKLENASH